MHFTASASSASLVAALLLTGCATHLQGTVSSETDPNLPVRPDMVVLLQASETDESTALRNRRQLPNIADRLRERGFKQVHTPLSPPPKNKPVELQVNASLTARTSVNQYTSPDYGVISPARTVTDCTTDAAGKKTCVQHTRQARTGVIGYSTKTDYQHDYTVKLTWYSARTGQLAMVSTLTARNPPCAEEENFELLIENGLPRLSFDTTRTDSFRVELAKDQCR
jgi:hypothetical protein